MFSFGKENVNEGHGVVVFNGGNAGKVNNVTVSVTKKGVDYQDEGKNKPDYQVVYTDDKGSSTNEGYYYLNEKTHNSQFGTFDKAVEKQWNKLAAIVVAAGGDPTIQATTPVEMLDKMAMLVKTSVPGKSFNVFANYGTKQNPKKYLQIRSWIPNIEAAGTPETESKLVPGGLDQLERITPDAPTSGMSAAPSMGAGGWV